MKKHRIFVAIDIPEELKNLAEVNIKEFYKNPLARVVEKENWHITAVFCGYLTDEELEKLKETAKNITQEIKKFELMVDKIIWAPPKRTPRMVWLTLKFSQSFSKLCSRLADYSQNNHEQIPHLTLIRFKEFHYPNLKNLLPQEGIGLKNKAEPFAVESINIMESHLSASGPKYELICRNCLK